MKKFVLLSILSISLVLPSTNLFGAEGADYNSSRSNKSHGIQENPQEESPQEENNKAQDHNSSRSNKTSTVINNGDSNETNNQRGTYLEIEGIKGESTEKAKNPNNENNEKAQDYNSSRSNKARGDKLPEDTIQQAQDHNASRSNKTSATIEIDEDDTDDHEDGTYLEIEGIKGESTKRTIKANQVSTDTDLDLFKNELIRTNKRIKKIRIEDNQIMITHQVPARFLGLIKSSIKMKTSLDSDNKLQIKSPWYGFLYKKDSVLTNLPTKFKKQSQKKQKNKHAKTASDIENLMQLFYGNDSAMNSVRNMK